MWHFNLFVQIQFITFKSRRSRSLCSTLQCHFVREQVDEKLCTSLCQLVGRPGTPQIMQGCTWLCDLWGRNKGDKSSLWTDKVSDSNTSVLERSTFSYWTSVLSLHKTNNSSINQLINVLWSELFESAGFSQRNPGTKVEKKRVVTHRHVMKTQSVTVNGHVSLAMNLSDACQHHRQRLTVTEERRDKTRPR